MHNLSQNLLFIHKTRTKCEIFREFVGVFEILLRPHHPGIREVKYPGYGTRCVWHQFIYSPLLTDGNLGLVSDSAMSHLAEGAGLEPTITQSKCVVIPI